MATYNLGRILPRFRGQWNPTVNYDKLDVVYFEGSSYMAISDNINKRPDENVNDWVLSAAKGEPGEPGKDGPTYKAGKGISITNNVISATGGGEGGGGETYFAGYGVEIDMSNNINTEVKASNDTPIGWKNITFTGLPESISDDWDENNIFYYKGDTYYSAGHDKHYRLNGLNWEPVVWSGFTDFYGKNVYVDSKNNMFYFNGNEVLKYDIDSEMWLVSSCNISNPQGSYIFQGADGYSYYSENRNKTYKIKDGSNTTSWTKVAVNQDCPAPFVWHDSTSTYFSDGSRQYVFDYDNERWITIKWRGAAAAINSLVGSNIWKQGDHVFLSNGNNNYILNGDTWELLNLTLGDNIFGTNVLYSGDKVYHYVDGDAKELELGELFYVTRHGDKLATEQYVLDHAGSITAGYGISTKKNDDGSTTISTVVSKSMKPSADYWTEIDSIKKGDVNLVGGDIQNIWSDYDNNTWLYDATGWYMWNGNDFITVQKQADVNIIQGFDVWKYQGRIFYSKEGVSYEFINGVWTTISFTYTSIHDSSFNGRYIASKDNKIYAFARDGSYSYIGRLNLNTLMWTFELIPGQTFSSIYPWFDNSGICYYGTLKVVNEEVVSSALRDFASSNVWFNDRDGAYYCRTESKTFDCITSNAPDWRSGQINLNVLSLEGRYIGVNSGGKCYELKEMKTVDDNNNTLINEHDLDIKLGLIDNILSKL